MPIHCSREAIWWAALSGPNEIKASATNATVTQANTAADDLATLLVKLRVKLKRRSDTAMMAVPAVKVSFTVSRKVVARSKERPRMQYQQDSNSSLV